jgi:hypothetical protein
MVGGHYFDQVAENYQQEQTQKLVFNDFTLLQGQVLLLTVIELHFHKLNLPDDHGQLTRRHWWEEYKPASPAPEIQGVVVKYADVFQQDACAFQNVVTLHLGDSFLTLPPTL